MQQHFWTINQTYYNNMLYLIHTVNLSHRTFSSVFFFSIHFYFHFLPQLLFICQWGFSKALLIHVEIYNIFILIYIFVRKSNSIQCFFFMKWYLESIKIFIQYNIGNIKFLTILIIYYIFSSILTIPSCVRQQYLYTYLHTKT